MPSVKLLILKLANILLRAALKPGTAFFIIALFVNNIDAVSVNRIDNTTPQITVNKQRGTTSELIKELEERSGWIISYSNQLCITDNARINKSRQSLINHLYDIFSDCQIDYLITDKRIIVSPLSSPPPRIFTISGYVREKGSGESLPAANIYSSNNQKGTVSNNYGFYSISLPEGKHYLRASYVGFRDKNESFNLTKDTTINFNLDKSTFLREVSIIGDIEHRETALSRHGATTLHMEDIKQAPAMLGETDIIKTIQMIPGIQGGSEGFSGLYVRGGGPDQNLILLDDVPVYNIGHLLGFFSIFNTDAVRNVSVHKGGFPARYGGRLSSVIDVRTKEGNKEEFEGVLNVGLLSSSIAVNGPIQKEKSSYAISFRRTYMDLIAGLIQRGNDEITNYYFYDINAKINQKINDKHRLYFSTYYGRDRYYTTYNYRDVELGVVPGTNIKADVPVNDENNAGWGNFVAALRWNYLITPRLFANLTATYSDYNFHIGVERNNEIDNVWDNYEQRYDSGIKDFGAKLDFDYYPLYNHHIKFGTAAILHEFNPGVDIIQRSLNTDQPVDTTFGDFTLRGSEFHLYAEDEFTYLQNNRINIGTRYILFEGEDKHYHKFEPRVAINRYISPNWQVRGNFSSMSQYIHMVSSSSITLPSDLWLPVTENIPPMHADQISAGAVHEKVLNKNKYTFEIDLYYKKLKNLLHYKESTGFFDYSSDWENKLTIGKGKSYGVEAIASKKTGKTTGSLAYTWAKTTNKFDDLNRGNSFPARYDRRHDINLNINHQLNNRVTANIQWQFGSGYPVTLPSEKYYAPDFPFTDISNASQYSENQQGINEFRMPAFHRLDLSFNFTKKRESTNREWSVGIINLYGRQNPFILYFDTDSESYSPGSSTRDLKQLSLFPFPIPFARYTITF
ncbi:TonB-dependent receptor [Marinilabiliaceae bacterium ANBcel2]|nr:TonB-dependent receptor [Marinilabiliaceae bacterium ANBcel2]